MGMKDIVSSKNVRITKVTCIGAIFFMGLIFSIQFLSGIVDPLSEQAVYENPLDKLRYFELEDSIPLFQEHYGHTEIPEHQPLEVRRSHDPAFWYTALSPYYEVFFKANTVRMSVQNSWIEYELKKMMIRQESGESQLQSEKPKIPSMKESLVNQNNLSFSEVFGSMDLSYTVNTSLLREALILKEYKPFTRIIQKIEWANLTPQYQEDRSILFLDEKGEKILKIVPPFMRDAAGAICENIHYELIETKAGYELHKVIDEKGLEWLQNAVYPVVIDPSMQTFEDAWESSGLQPYGQYFRNLREYVNPSNGHLTVTQTDLVIPGRGLNLNLSRVYEMPAVFYGSDPYEYESAPTDVGKGWMLDFPYIGTEYVHLWGGTVFKITWTEDQFINLKGKFFTLVKNQDSTYTLTTSSGITYEFNTSGKLTQIKDLDQNTVNFSYTNGDLTSITDTIGRIATLSYSNGRLWKITYNGNDIEYSYDANGCLQWMDDFLDRRTEYSYNTGYNDWLLSGIEYPTGGYTLYTYDRYTDGDYYKYHVTDQVVYETDQVRHLDFSYTGSFEKITSSVTTVKNESDVTQGSYNVTMNNDGLITQIVVKNSSDTAIRKFSYTYNSTYELTQENVYNDGSTLSYAREYAYDNYGNVIYFKNGEGHEQFFSYANTSTSGLFVDGNGTIIKKFTNAFSNSTVPTVVRNALLGMAEKQDETYVREVYYTYDSEGHPTQNTSSFGNATTWLTFSGTVDESTGDTSFPIDLSGHTVSGTGVLKVAGSPSTPNYIETRTHNCEYPYDACLSVSGSWAGKYYSFNYKGCLEDPFGQVRCNYDETTSIGPFTHYPGTLGYQSYTTEPGMNERFYTFKVKAKWKAYPAKVDYNLDNSAWKTITTNLRNNTAQISCPISDGTHTLYFSESSSYENRFSWYLYVPVDNTPDEYTTSLQYDTYGNVTSIIDTDSNTYTISYSATYSHAYPTQISYTVDSDTVSQKATYDYYRGWVTSIQQPKGVDAGSGYDYLFTYDVLGRIIKKEFPLLSGQSQRSYIEAVYDCENRTTTIIDQNRHYVVQQYDKLGRQTSTKWYTGTYGPGTLYATASYTHRYDNLLKTATDPGNHTTTYTYDFLGRLTHAAYPDTSSVSYSYDDTNNKITFTNRRGYDSIYWYDWVSQLAKVEEEYASSLFATTSYQYDEAGHLTSLTDAENNTTSYTYASLFGLTKTTLPDSTYEEYEYNNMGRITSFVDAMGNQTTYTYDDIYRLTQIQYQNSNSWHYYKQITVSNFSSDYQYKVTVHKGSGTDDAHNVYLNNHCQDDFDDIRFRGSDKTTELDHYRESYTSGASAVFWVKLPETEENLYIFYGNSSVSSASNGSSTFIFFDDCEAGSATDTWTENSSAYGDVGYSTAQAKFGSKSLYAEQTSSENNYNISAAFADQTSIVIDFWSKQNASDNNVRTATQDTDTSTWSLTVQWYDANQDLRYYRDGWIDTGASYTTNWEHHEFICTASDDKILWRKDGSPVVTDAHRDSWSDINKLYLFLGSNNDVNDTAYYDNIYVRKYEATAPSFAFGSETETEDYQSQTVSFAYDLNSNRIRMDDDSPSTGDYVEYMYDEWNRLTSETRHISTNTYTVSYQYDVANRLTKLTYPDNMQIVYTYDDLNRTTEIKRYIDGSNDEILLDNVQYTTENLLTQFDYGNDLQAAFSYDSRDRLSNLDVKNGATSYLDLDYTYDNSSNITQLVNGWRDTGSNWHSETESYSYDGLDRLTSASCTSWSHSYSYDKVGNRTAKDGITYTINTVNEVTALSDGTSFTYDSNGNRIGKEKGTDSWEYNYDLTNRLIELKKDSSTLGEYAYDGDGNRIQVTENNVTTIYIHSGLNPVYEENSTGSACYVYGPKGLLAKRTTINQETNTFYYHTDDLGSPRLVTDDSKNIVVAMVYHPFGELSTEEGSEHYLFTGKEKDTTGLYYYGARYYDPETARFLTRDPHTSLPDDPRFIGINSGNCAKMLKTPQRFNQYTYVLNNPLKYTDPTGLGPDALLDIPSGSTPSDDEEQDIPECCDDECLNLCSGDQQHARGGGNADGNDGGSEGEAPGDSNPDDDDMSTQEYCANCYEKCNEEEAFQKLLKRRRKLTRTILMGAFLAGLACAVGAIAATALVATVWAYVIGGACGAAAGWFLKRTMDKPLNEIDHEITKLGCECYHSCEEWF